MEKVNNGTGQLRVEISPQPTLCIIKDTSIARQGLRHFNNNEGMVLADLSKKERVDIHLILLIMNTDRLHELAGQVLLYDDDKVDIDYTRSLETKQAKIAGRRKALFDYTYLLKSCEAISSPCIDSYIGR